MRQFFFNSLERRRKLHEEINSWLGTPWAANSAAKGERGGVSCHNLPIALYKACGHLTEAFPVVVSDPNVTRHKKQSVMEPFLDARPEFRRLNLEKEFLCIGDLIGLRIYHCTDHLGVLEEGAHFIHVLMHKKTAVDSLIDPTWRTRLTTAWRPVA
ncbi:MAG TPA: hypothetical protein VHG71_04935 [Verrucomicrobiae bacterium]|nr:hypothetical protein [Verrucomicrobiae bacterium]